MSPAKRQAAADPGVPREEPSGERSFIDELRPDFKRVQWYVQRAIWGVIILVIVMAGAGFLAAGPVSDRRVSAFGPAGDVEANYPRFVRLKAPHQVDLTIRVTSDDVSDIKLIVPSTTQRNIRMDALEPQPDSVNLSPIGSVYTWPVTQPGEFSITLRYEPLHWPRLEFDVGVQLGQARAQVLEMRQLVLP